MSSFSLFLTIIFVGYSQRKERDEDRDADSRGRLVSSEWHSFEERRDDCVSPNSRRRIRYHCLKRNNYLFILISFFLTDFWILLGSLKREYDSFPSLSFAL